MGIGGSIMVMKTILVPILNDEYKVVVCWGDTAYINKVLKKYKQPERDLFEFTDYRGKTFMHSHCYPVIALTSEPKTADIIATLAHESVHAIEYIFTYIGEQSRDELFAHSIGSIVRITLEKYGSQIL